MKKETLIAFGLRRESHTWWGTEQGMHTSETEAINERKGKEVTEKNVWEIGVIGRDILAFQSSL